MAHDGELLRDYHFTVDIDGFERLHFTEVTGLAVDVAAIHFRSGADLDTGGKILPGRATYEPVTFRRGLARNLELWQWLATIAGGQSDPRNVTISVLDEEHQTAVAFQLASAWPSRLELGPLAGLGNGVAIEELTLTYERLGVDSA